jgi:hypothetical protein
MDRQKPYRFVSIQECKPGDLIRATIKPNETRWAIVAQSRRLVMLSGVDGPHTVSTTVNGKILEGLVAYAPLNYGSNYAILPTHDGPCDVGMGNLFKTPGSLIAAGDDLFLYVPGQAQESLSYLDLAAFTLHGEPGGSRAAFGAWTLWYDALASQTPSIALLRHEASVNVG